MLLLRRRATTNCGNEGDLRMIWGDVDRERRLKALLVAFALVVGVVALSFGAVAALS